MPFWSKDKKANQQAAAQNQVDAPVATQNNNFRQDGYFDQRNHHERSQNDLNQQRYSQTRTREEGGKREREHRFRKSKNRSYENHATSSTDAHQMEPASPNIQPPPRQHSPTFPGASPSDQRVLLPGHGQNGLQARQAPIGQPARGLWSWIPHVKQSAADATVVENVKVLFVLAEQFVSNYYSPRAYHGEVPNEILDRVNYSTSMTTSELQNSLTTANLQNPIITHVLVNLFLNLIAFDLMDSQESLLPKEFQNYMILAKARTRSTSLGNEEREEQPALSSYRVLSAFLRSDIKDDQNYLSERWQVIEKVTSRFERAFQHWANSERRREDRSTMLRKLLENAGDLGIFLFSQPAVYVFNWEKDHPGTSDGRIAIWPRLLRVYDNDAQWKEPADHMIPIKLGLVIDESTKDIERTKPTNREIGAVDTRFPHDTNTSQVTQSLNLYRDEDDMQHVDMTASQRIAHGTVMVEEANEVADVSDEDIQSRNSWSQFDSDVSEHMSKKQNPFATETNTPPEFREHLNMREKSTDASNVPASLRPGSRNAQVREAVAIDTIPQLTANRVPHSRDNSASLEESQWPYPPPQESVSLHGQSLQTSNFSPFDAQPWLNDDRNSSSSSRRGSPARAYLAERPRGPRTTESPRNASPVQDVREHTVPRKKLSKNASEYGRPSSAVYTTQPRAHTVDSYDTQPVFAPSYSNSVVQDLYQNASKPDRRQPSLDNQISSRYYPNKQYEEKERESRRPRASSNDPPKVENRSRGTKTHYPPQAYNRQFSSSHPDRMTAAEDRQWEGQQITPTAEGEYGRGRSSHDSNSSRHRRRSSSVTSLKRFLQKIGPQDR